MPLLVPIVREAQGKSLGPISQELHALIEKTHQGTIPNEDRSDGTFTITNLGMFEIENFTPIKKMQAGTAVFRRQRKPVNTFYGTIVLGQEGA